MGKKMDARQYIRIRGANENNLKNIDVDIPRNELVVLTGLSGSGKSSLAFDTIYAEGQRRYMESLSSYARQFLGQMEKPDVESIEGLSPAISIDQKSTNHNPRSTVGTVTEIYDYFRLLYARIGIPHCPKCGKEIKKQTVDQMVDQVMALPEGTKIQLLAPVVRGRKGTHAKLFERAKKSGYVRVRVDGNLYELSEDIALDKNIKHNIEIIVDRLVVKPGIEKRMTDSVESVLSLAEGLLIVDIIGGEPMNFSQSFSCPDCGISIEEIEPRSFSFNNPFGACPTCFGLGYKMEFDEDLMIPDPTLSIQQGAIAVMGWQSCTEKSSFTRAILDALCEEYHFDLETPFQDYPKEIHDVLVSAVQEAHNMALLDLEVMVVDLQTEANFLDFRGALVAARLTSFDLLVVLVLAVIDELGDRRLRVGRHLDEIEVRFLCQVQCDGSRDDSHLLAVRADQTHLGDANLVVNAWFVADDDSNPHIPCNGTSFDWQFSKVSIVQGMPKRITTRRKPVRAAYISHRDDRWKASA